MSKQIYGSVFHLNNLKNTWVLLLCLMFTQNIFSEVQSHIQNAQQGSSFLRQKAVSQNLSSGELYYEDGKWSAEIKPSSVIRKIHITAVTRDLRRSLLGVRRQFIGVVENDEVREEFQSAAIQALQLLGYPHVKVGVVVKKIKPHVVDYEVTVHEGAPCEIASISLPFPLPDSVVFSLKEKSLCDLKEVQSAVDRLDQDLRTAGYHRVRLNVRPMSFDRNKTKGYVRVEGELGVRVEVEFRQERTSLSVDQIFRDDALNELDPALIEPESIASEVTRIYVNQGYEDVQVTGPQTSRPDDQTVRHTFVIRLGARYTLGDIQFEGGIEFSRKEMIDVMGLQSVWESSIALNRDDLNEGVESLKEFYRRQGYWNVKIRPPRITREENTASANVVILIDEGPRYVLEDAKIEGFDGLPLQKHFKVQKQSALDRTALLDAETELRRELINLGYLKTTVSTVLKHRFGGQRIETVVVFKVDPGVRVYVGSIRILGLIRTEESVVRRELRFKSGDFYNPENILESRAALIGLGLFRYVQITPTRYGVLAMKPNELDVTIQVQESDPGDVRFGPGYHIRRGLLYGFEGTYKNIGGRARTVSLRGELSQELNQEVVDQRGDERGRSLLGKKISLGYVEPYLLDYPIDGQLSLSHKEVADEFWKISTTGEMALNHKIWLNDPSSEIGLYYAYQITRDRGSKEQLLAISSGNAKIADIGVRGKLDLRDDVSWTTKGGVLSAQMSLSNPAWGSDFRFGFWSLSAAWFYEVLPKFVWSVSGALSAYNWMGDVDILPTTLRLFAGGSGRVRGFEHQLGPYIRTQVREQGESGEFVPVDDEIPQVIGGAKRSLFRTEARIQLSELWGSSFFLDSGNVFFSDQEVERFGRELSQTVGLSDDRERIYSMEDNVNYSFSELLWKPGYLLSRHYLSYGVAVNFLSPLGAVNLGYAWPWKEPQTKRCIEEGICFSRAKECDWYCRGQFELTVGSQF
ncbi:MAG: outer membrane protein assembly factor [Oligoflexales bacterium]